MAQSSSQTMLNHFSSFPFNMTKTSLLLVIKEEEICPAENIPTTAGLWSMPDAVGTEPTELAPFPEKGLC